MAATRAHCPVRSCGAAALASDPESGLRVPAEGRHPGLSQPDDEALRAQGFVPYETPSPFVNFIGGCWQRRDVAAQAVDVALRVLPEHCNTHGTLHGGMALVLADQVLAMTSKLLTRRNGVTMHVDADLLASAPGGALVRGRARILRQTGATAFVEAHLHVVTAAEPETMILRCSGVVRLLAQLDD